MRLRQATLCAAFALLATGGAHAVDLSARLQRQCPATVAWTNAHPSVEISQNQKNSYDAAHRASEPALRKELATRFARDQKIRHELIASDYSAVARRAMMADDASNVAWLKLLIEQRGFPSIAQVGFEGVSHAFILVQHATRDPALQARVLREIKPRLRSDGISNNEYALLFDRVRVEQGKLQVYGSQFVISTNKNGIADMHLRPLEDPSHVDKRRAALGLMPLSDYQCILQVVYTPPSKGGRAVRRAIK